MSSTFDVISLMIMSLKNFQDAVLAEKVISKINEYGKDYIPQVFGYYEPLKQKYDINNTKSVVDVWVK